MMADRYLKRLFVLVFLAALPSRADAGYIYESATLGTTGITSGFNPSVDDRQFVGVRFDVTSTVTTGTIGGHFGGFGNFFGAIVALSGPTDVPDSFSLSTPDVLGSTLINFPFPSDDTSAPLTLTLTPGWYALVFGSGLFAATGGGYAPVTNTDVGTPSFFFSRNFNDTWGEGGYDNARFFVTEAQARTPEPSSVILLALGAMGVWGMRSLRRSRAN
jgi:hypothetical protein